MAGLERPLPEPITLERLLGGNPARGWQGSVAARPAANATAPDPPRSALLGVLDRLLTEPEEP
jgi:hypothetical protein